MGSLQDQKIIVNTPGQADAIMAEATPDVQMEDADYEHGEELLLGGAKKLVIVSLTRFSETAILTVVLLLVVTSFPGRPHTPHHFRSKRKIILSAMLYGILSTRSIPDTPPWLVLESTSD
jgi:hypothetical protein